MEYTTQHDLLAKLQNLPNLDPKDYDQTALLLSEYIKRGRITDVSIKIKGGKKNINKLTGFSKVDTYTKYSDIECAPMIYTDTDKYIPLSSLPLLTADFLDLVILYVGIRLHTKDTGLYSVYIPKDFKPYLIKHLGYKPVKFVD